MYGHYRDGMIELLKIIKGMHDPTCVPHFHFTELSENPIRSRGNKYKLTQHHSHYDFSRIKHNGVKIYFSTNRFAACLHFQIFRIKCQIRNTRNVLTYWSQMSNVECVWPDVLLSSAARGPSPLLGISPSRCYCRSLRLSPASSDVIHSLRSGGRKLLPGFQHYVSHTYAAMVIDFVGYWWWKINRCC